jgi:RNA polymerase sigma factor (sigma-70 family)
MCSQVPTTPRGRRPHDVGSTRTVHAALFERAKVGDEVAWRKLIVTFHPAVERAVRRVCRSSDVDEVVQEVWMLLLDHGHTVGSADRLPGWLRAVALNAALRHVRWRTPVQSELPGQDIPTHDDPTRHLAATATRSEVESALQRLEADERRLLVLSLAGDRPNYAMTCRTIACIGPARRRLLEQLNDPPALRLAAS